MPMPVSVPQRCSCSGPAQWLRSNIFKPFPYTIPCVQDLLTRPYAAVDVGLPYRMPLFSCIQAHPEPMQPTSKGCKKEKRHRYAFPKYAHPLQIPLLFIPDQTCSKDTANRPRIRRTTARARPRSDAQSPLSKRPRRPLALSSLAPAPQRQPCAHRRRCPPPR